MIHPYAFLVVDRDVKPVAIAPERSPSTVPERRAAQHAPHLGDLDVEAGGRHTAAASVCASLAARGARRSISRNAIAMTCGSRDHRASMATSAIAPHRRRASSTVSVRGAGCSAALRRTAAGRYAKYVVLNMTAAPFPGRMDGPAAASAEAGPSLFENAKHDLPRAARSPNHPFNFVEVV